MMKRTIILLFLFGCLLAPQCSLDKGNYNYHEFNEITIQGVADRPLVTVVNDGIDKLHIEPQLEMTENVDPDSDRFRYRWLTQYMMNPGTPAGYYVIDTIAATRILDWVPPVTFYTAGNTTLIFRVTDLHTGLTTSSTCLFRMSVFHSRGWLLIGENAQGNVQCQMVNMLAGRDTLFFPNLLEHSGLPTLQGPINFFHSGGGAGYIKLWVVTKSGSYWVDNVTLESSPTNTFGSLMFNAPAQINLVDMSPPIRTLAGGSSNFQRYVLCDDGNLYSASMSYTGDYYGFPVNVLENDRSNPISARGPLLCNMLGTGTGAAMWYDQANERFMFALTPGVYLYSEAAPDSGENPTLPFPWDQAGTGRTYLYGENTSDNVSAPNNFTNCFALMAKGRDSAFIYTFRVPDNPPPVKVAAYTIDPLPANFLDATSYTFAANQTTMFYIVSGKLYMLEYQTNVMTPIDFWNGDEVTMAKIDHVVAPRENHLYVATYNPATGGKITKYILSGGTTLTKAPNSEWTGLVKIKNMTWRGVE